MSTFKNTKFITNNFGTLFLVLLIGCLITGGLTQKNNYLTKTPLLHLGTASWEVNTSGALQRNVLEAWAKNIDSETVVHKDTTVVKHLDGLHTALDQNEADYGFILFYTAILLLCFIRLSGMKVGGKQLFSAWQTDLWIIIVVTAAVLDVLEDLGTAKTIHAYLQHQQQVSVLYVCIPAILKWLLIIAVVVQLIIAAIKLDKPRIWLQDFSRWLGSVLGYAWEFRLVLITLLVFVMVLFVSDQGQDLLISINSDPTACLLFIITTTLLALLCWHLPKAIDNADNLTYLKFWVGPVDYIEEGTDHNNDGQKRPKVKLDIGRLMGAAAFLVPAVGILNTMQAYKIGYLLDGISPWAVLAAILFLYTIALRGHWIELLYKKGDGIYWGRYFITVAILLAPVAVAGLAGHANRQPYFLAYLSLDLVMLSAVFLITTTLRTCIPTVNNWRVAPFITFSALAGFVFFIACNFYGFVTWLTLKSTFFTMPMVFLAVGGYLLFSAFLLFIGKKTGITIITLLFILSFYISEHTITTYHNVQVLSGDTTRKSPDSLTRYARAWLINRKAEITAFNKDHHAEAYPVFFVNAYGGGIRASVWTTMVMGTLDSIALNCQQGVKKPKDFRHYVFSMSGASGGTIGLAILSAQRSYYINNGADSLTSFKNDIYSYPGNYALIYGHDYLSADIAGLLGRDMLASSIGLNEGVWDDRGRLMERDWENRLGNYSFKFGAPLHSFWKKGKFELPLFFSNTYDVDKGMKGTLAPVLLSPLDFPHTLFPEQELKTGDELRLSTAAFLSARFPYVSPTGKLYGDHHFTDGGTWENAGAQTSREVEQVFMAQLEKLQKEKDSGFDNLKIKVVFLSIPNGYEAQSKEEGAKNLFEPLAPVHGLLSLIDAHEVKADSVNSAYAKKHQFGFYTLRPLNPPAAKGNTISPVLPLGWQISGLAMAKMNENITVVNSKNIYAILSNMGYVPKAAVKR